MATQSQQLIVKLVMEKSIANFAKYKFAKLLAQNYMKYARNIRKLCNRK